MTVDQYGTDVLLGVSACAMRNNIIAFLISIDCALQCLQACKRTKLIHIASPASRWACMICCVTEEGWLLGWMGCPWELEATDRSLPTHNSLFIVLCLSSSPPFCLSVCQVASLKALLLRVQILFQAHGIFTTPLMDLMDFYTELDLKVKNPQWWVVIGCCGETVVWTELDGRFWSENINSEWLRGFFSLAQNISKDPNS